MFLGVYALMATLVIAVLSIFLHQCSRSSSQSGVSCVAGVGCPESGPQYSSTNMDFMNVDIYLYYPIHISTELTSTKCAATLFPGAMGPP